MRATFKMAAKVTACLDLRIRPLSRGTLHWHWGARRLRSTQRSEATDLHKTVSRGHGRLQRVQFGIQGFMRGAHSRGVRNGGDRRSAVHSVSAGRAEDAWHYSPILSARRSTVPRAQLLQLGQRRISLSHRIVATQTRSLGFRFCVAETARTLILCRSADHGHHI